MHIEAGRNNNYKKKNNNKRCLFVPYWKTFNLDKHRIALECLLALYFCPACIHDTPRLPTHPHLFVFQSWSEADPAASVNPQRVLLCTLRLLRLLVNPRTTCSNCSVSTCYLPRLWQVFLSSLVNFKKRLRGNSCSIADKWKPSKRINAIIRSQLWWLLWKTNSDIRNLWSNIILWLL